MKPTTLASTLAIALAASAVSLTPTLAFAAGANPYDTFDATVGSPAGAIVGVGSDTTQIVVHALSDEWNLTHSPKLSSFAADGLPASVDLRDSAAQPAIQRSVINGSGNGKKALFGTGNNPEVNFARSSSSLNAAETSAGLKQAAFAVDGLKMAVSTTTNAPANITPQQVVGIYKGTITNWSQIDAMKSGVIKPYIPQGGSGTRSFFETKLAEVNGGAVTLAGVVGVSQEHSAAEIESDPNAIAPFSTARASDIGTIKLLSGTEWKRAVYNVVRNADTTNPDIASILGKNGFVCSPEGRQVIEDIGFVPLATEAQGGQCGVWLTEAVTDVTSFDDAPLTTTTLAGSAAGSTVTLTATIGGLNKAGTVVFKEGGTQVGTPKTVAAGKATLTLSGVAAGSHSYTAHFTPQDPMIADPSASSAVIVTVSAAVAGAFVPVAPARLLDTRNGTGGAAGKVAKAGTVSFQVAGAGGVPSSGVGAVVLNVTVTAPTAGGFVTAFPTGEARPNASNLNFLAGQTSPNHVTVKVGAGGKVSLYNGSAGSAHLFADVAGWYRAGAATDAGMFTPISPQRLVDTRSGIGAPKAKVAARGTLPFAVAGQASIPASGAGAGVLNVTVTQPTAGGFITAFPSGTARPNASNLNFLGGQTVPNAATVKIGGDGKVALFNASAGTSHLFADVAGWFRSGAATAPGAFTSLNPTRVLDTRAGVGAAKVKVAAGKSVTLTVAGAGGVPGAGAGAVVLNTTVTSTTSAGFITAFPAGQSRPNASNLNFVSGQTVANLVTVKLSADGKVTFYNGSAKPVDLLADIAGWYKG